ncbi:hypothetical protein DFH29DRAFT_242020 [Suillus ampliporus]|nr:hypothetical protein DFH29DRAFT_242020 [Suillus ampliporus]
MSQSHDFPEHALELLSPSTSRPLSPPTSRGEHSDADSKDLERKPLSFKQSPPAILLEILEYALPPTVFLDPSLACGPFSAWRPAQRVKKSIVLVCKFWREIGTVLLYREIHFGASDKSQHSRVLCKVMPTWRDDCGHQCVLLGDASVLL